MYESVKDRRHQREMSGLPSHLSRPGMVCPGAVASDLFRSSGSRKQTIPASRYEAEVQNFFEQAECRVKLKQKIKAVRV